MKILLVIIFFHTLVVIRAKLMLEDRTPYFSVFLLSSAMAAAVALLMINMEVPG